MRISGMNNVNGVYKANKIKKAYSQANTSKTSDTLAISEHAKELQLANKAIKEAPDVRQTRIDEIKAQMEAGTYNVSASEIADKLVEKYLG